MHGESADQPNQSRIHASPKRSGRTALAFAPASTDRTGQHDRQDDVQGYRRQRSYEPGRHDGTGPLRRDPVKKSRILAHGDAMRGSWSKYHAKRRQPRAHELWQRRMTNSVLA
jgi:hypothetical protein